MPDKDDASTNIEAAVTGFIKNMNDACTELRKARIEKNKKAAKKLPDPPIITFAMSKNAITKGRTPAQQAELVSNGTSWVCWSAHMTDKARDILMKANGNSISNPQKTMGEDFAAFKQKWATAMSSNGLKNYKAGDGWADGDSFHLELPDSKITRTDSRAKACLEEYARLTRSEGKKKHDKFEKSYASLLAKYFATYEKTKK